jgi:hypothetical protein
MKKLLLLVPVFLLAGCLESVPVKRNFPAIPEELKTACPELQKVEPGTTQLSKVMEIVVDNYSTYYECRVKVDAFLQWHQEQKKIFEEVK